MTTGPLIARWADEPTALYRIFDSSGKLLYVGISCNPPARMHGHAADKPWWLEVAEIRVEWLPNRAIALDAEREAILREAPPHNRAPGTGKGRDEPHSSVRALLRSRMRSAEINIHYLRGRTGLSNSVIFDVLHHKGPPNDAQLAAIALCLGIPWREITELRDHVGGLQVEAIKRGEGRRP